VYKRGEAYRKNLLKTHGSKKESGRGKGRGKYGTDNYIH
jgi:hypothetical protein